MRTKVTQFKCSVRYEDAYESDTLQVFSLISGCVLKSQLKYSVRYEDAYYSDTIQ
ncbi:hypothetical protein CHS0354_012384, partial [Potamilus streckersoni]